MPAAHSPLVVVITLNWNHCADTLAFLDSCAKLSYPNYRVIAVDNASTDGSTEAIQAQFPDVIQVLNPANWGFAKGMNQGIAKALELQADYVFLANNDTTLADDALDLLVAAAEANQAALVSPAIYYYDRPGTIWWLGGTIHPVLLEIKRYLRPPSERAFPVDFITGCGMLISRACLQTVGELDERFFMYYEDADYCLRVHRAGLQTMVEPKASMYHKVSSSSGGNDSPHERYMVAVSSLLYFRKHAKPWQWLAIGPYRLGSTLLTLWRLRSPQKRPAAQAYLRGLWQGITQS